MTTFKPTGHTEEHTHADMAHTLKNLDILISCILSCSFLSKNKMVVKLNLHTYIHT